MKRSISNMIPGLARSALAFCSGITKTQNFPHRLLPSLALTGLASLALLAFTGKPGSGYVAHEWGTFTSVQGGDGVLVDWEPLSSSRLPGFVYNWTKAGFQRSPCSALLSPKASIRTLQRMETPVIYFYAQAEQSVNVSVQFPKGLITEWYPQTAQIGPASVPPPWLISKLDDCAHHAGVKSGFTFASMLRTPALSQSEARWMHVDILPPRQTNFVSLPLDSSGSHYFAARETDANDLAVPILHATNTAPEHEKFLFYRGVANFETPLRVTTEANESVTLANTGPEPLDSLFLLGVRDKAGDFIAINRLAPGEHRTLDLSRKTLSPDSLSSKLGHEIEQALVKQGLYAREAAAMVKTWSDSWLQEDGLRVLYILPRAWTDRTLPLRLDPAPSQLTRVMVGRAEILSPALERRLAQNLGRAANGDLAARDQLLDQFKRLGRFADPALRLATDTSPSEYQQTGWDLLHLANTQQNPKF